MMNKHLSVLGWLEARPPQQRWDVFTFAQEKVGSLGPASSRLNLRWNKLEDWRDAFDSSKRRAVVVLCVWLLILKQPSPDHNNGVHLILSERGEREYNSNYRPVLHLGLIEIIGWVIGALCDIRCSTMKLWHTGRTTAFYTTGKLRGK